MGNVSYTSNQDKKADTDRVVEYLNRSFAYTLQKASDRLGTRDNSKGTLLYQYQVDFCYLINSIERDPGYIGNKNIQEANALIERLEKEGITTN